mgnify:CR=1 FL=1
MYSFIKRLIDFTVALVALVILSPIIISAAFLLMITNKGTPFFVQSRPGKNNRIFSLIKFKTMNDKQDDYGKLLPDSERLTNIGRVIRSTSIDELPQLINVLKGDMSLVGPRPLLIKYLNRYTPHQARRHEVRPGITGLAQVNGRNELSWDKKFEWDIYYVDHLSFQMDVAILFQTLKAVFLRRGINSNTHATMKEFMGSQ